MMRPSQITYLRTSLLLPLVVPLVGFLVAIVAWLFGTTLPREVEELLEYSIGGIFYLGPVYATLALSLLAALRNRSLRSHVVAAVIAPLIMASLLELGTVIILREEPSEGARLIKIALQLGYIYVCLALIGLWIGTRFGYLSRADRGRSPTTKC